jgi:hypothetical protein
VPGRNARPRLGASDDMGCKSPSEIAQPKRLAPATKVAALMPARIQSEGGGRLSASRPCPNAQLTRKVMLPGRRTVHRRYAEWRGVQCAPAALEAYSNPEAHLRHDEKVHGVNESRISGLRPPLPLLAYWQRSTAPFLWRCHVDREVAVSRLAGSQRDEEKQLRGLLHTARRSRTIMARAGGGERTRKSCLAVSSGPSKSTWKAFFVRPIRVTGA